MIPCVVTRGAHRTARTSAATVTLAPLAKFSVIGSDFGVLDRPKIIRWLPPGAKAMLPPAGTVTASILAIDMTPPAIDMLCISIRAPGAVAPMMRSGLAPPRTTR